MGFWPGFVDETHVLPPSVARPWPGAKEAGSWTLQQVERTTVGVSTLDSSSLASAQIESVSDFMPSVAGESPEMLALATGKVEEENRH
jgi:hypothetical protein